ncbi:L,D-transpeptidase family protein [Sneathiella aquimaris]|uniref:L,D-transpeptidase family protein n=1 Tax=Sneathiella aquimaris TaxID=2599305 RepID=UPI00146DD0AC|nr:L,D-transpeptidase family protein [Sneathiella aquimaris]
MNIRVKQNKIPFGTLSFDGQSWPCAVGKSGVTADKKEGDHASPAGVFPIRAVYFRADRIDRPRTSVPVFEISEKDGWCDDPSSAAYNQKITLPFEDRHECLMREDHLYDLIVVLGHNDNPPIPGKGSCIFMHVAKEDYSGTEGCVALRLDHLQSLLGRISTETCLEITLP